MDIKYSHSMSTHNYKSTKKINDLKSIYRISRERFNEANGQSFKKTNWKKFLYSCGGYGGRCGNCKHWDLVKERNTEKNCMVKKLKDIKEKNMFYL